jgi:hypothetical protein
MCIVTYIDVSVAFVKEIFRGKYNNEMRNVGQLFSDLAYIGLCMNNRSKTGVSMCRLKYINIMALYAVTFVI